MPSTVPWSPTYDFGSDAAPQNLINAEALQAQLLALAAFESDLCSDLSAVIGPDNSLVDAIVRLRTLHPEVYNWMTSAMTGNLQTTALQWFEPVVAASAANVAVLSGPQTIDGVACVANDRVLLLAQTSAAQNGLWVVKAGAWTRATDLPAGAAPTGWGVMVEAGGTVNGETAWYLIAGGSAPPVVGTDALAFGAIWGPYPLPISKGGTGGATAAAALAALGGAAKAVVAFTLSGALTYTVTHNLGTREIIASVIDPATGITYGATITATTTNAATVVFTTEPLAAATALNLIVIG